MLVLSLGLALYVIFHSLVQLAHVPYRLSYVLAYARARHQLRVKEPQSFRSKVRGAKSLANAVTSEVARVEPIAVSMHASIREELESMVSEEVDAINDEPDVAFDSPEARAALIKSRREFARAFDSKILSMEQELLREVNMERLGRVEGEATPANPHDSRFWFMLTALVFPWEFTLLQDDLALVRRELQRLRVDSAGDRLEYRRELDEQLQRLRSMPQPYLDFATELRETAQAWAIERQQRLAREEESEEEVEEEEDEDDFLEEEFDEVEDVEKKEAESSKSRRRAPMARKKKGKAKAEATEEKMSMPVRSAAPARPPLLKAAAPPPPPGGGGRLEQSIHREWSESSKQLLTTSGFLGDDMLDREPRALLRSSFGYGEASDMTEQDFAGLSAPQVEDVSEVTKMLDFEVNAEVDAINDEPDVAFDSPEARTALVESRREFARTFEESLLSMEQNMFREVNLERLGRTTLRSSVAICGVCGSTRPTIDSSIAKSSASNFSSFSLCRNRILITLTSSTKLVKNGKSSASSALLQKK
ncbi:Hypothetical Protein FCC1311_111402 [Hondaea fermentalgiana]|uniref:Uncharacterized protein n=1 Tax=Hondaea fermentalgiana TaxID=2315210 RepID=A0A2R5GVQ8_9STRA|nr:Hypothetical Protein FCC1311_111402 [Hondaea fermentalgiana]|eukprot:GBG34917.1 Hypothetical Protein FCC1311_111402 [Hondaea fermentalgiana]